VLCPTSAACGHKLLARPVTLPCSGCHRAQAHAQPPVRRCALPCSLLQPIEWTAHDHSSRMQVTNVEATKIYLSNGEQVPYGVCLWSAGNEARPITQELVAQLPEQARFANPRSSGQKLAVDSHLRIIGAEHAFAGGDCSRIVTGSLPPTAQVRLLQCRRNCTFACSAFGDLPPEVAILSLSCSSVHGARAMFVSPGRSN
jgi:hypothetical protein